LQADKIAQLQEQVKKTAEILRQEELLDLQEMLNDMDKVA